jgi:hypothetical protein
MKKLLALLVVAVAAVAIGVTAAMSSGDGRTVLKFDTMAPVVAPYTGATNRSAVSTAAGSLGSSRLRRGGFAQTDG